MQISILQLTVLQCSVVYCHAVQYSENIITAAPSRPWLHYPLLTQLQQISKEVGILVRFEVAHLRGGSQVH